MGLENEIARDVAIVEVSLTRLFLLLQQNLHWQ